MRTSAIRKPVVRGCPPDPRRRPVSIQPIREPASHHRLAIVTALISASLAIQLFLTLHAPLWRDEAQTVFIARLPRWPAVVDALAHDGAAPLFYFLLRCWIHLTGGSDVAIRLLPALLFSLAPPILFIVGENLAGRWVGLAAAAWLLLNPIVADAGGEVRMYGLVTSLGIITLWGWTRFMQDRALRSGLIGAAGNILLLYAHNIGLFVLVTTQCAWIIWAICAKRRQALDRRTVARWVALQALIAVAYLPWAPVLFRQLSYQLAPWSEPPNFEQAIGLLAYLCPLQLPAPWDLRACVAFGLLAALAAACVFTRPKFSRLRPVFGMSLGGIVLYIAVCEFTGVFGPRYILPWIPMLALGIIAFAAKALPRSAAWAVGLCLVALAGAGLNSQWSLLAQPTNAPEIADALARSSIAADDLVVLPWQAGAPSINYYLHPGRGTETSFPTRKRVEIIDWAFIEKSLSDQSAFRDFLSSLADYAASGKTIWVISRSVVLTLPPPGRQKFLNLEQAREIETIQEIARLAGYPALTVAGCDCSRESFSLLRFQPPGPHMAVTAYHR